MLSQAVAACWKQGFVYTDSDTDTDTPSTLYTVLPALIQNRVPKIRSIRRTAIGRGKTTAASHTRSDSDGSRTPPPSYHTSARTSLVIGEDEEYDAFHSLPPSRPSSSGSATPACVLDTEDNSGVQWKYAKQGLSLLSLAAQEESLAAHDVQFNRKLYLDSIGYLLRGLPNHLTVDEQTALRFEIPPVLTSEMSEDTGLAGALAERSAAKQQPRSVVHQTVATITVQLFVLAAFILPYLQLLLQQAYEYDRKHKVTDRLLAQSLLLADAMGKKSVVVANQVSAMHDGKVGTAMMETGMWWLQGVSGGLCDGVGQGMQVLKLQEASAARREEPDRLGC